jgi:hypothetical protein
MHILRGKDEVAKDPVQEPGSELPATRVITLMNTVAAVMCAWEVHPDGGVTLVDPPLLKVSTARTATMRSPLAVPDGLVIVNEPPLDPPEVHLASAM